MSLSSTALLARATVISLVVSAAAPSAASTEPAGGKAARPGEARPGELARRWAIKTHIYLAEEVLRDLLPDGKLTIHRTNYRAGTIDSTNSWELAVEPDLLAAIRAHPEAFRAGVMAGDSYPDVLTGQSVVHPEKARVFDTSAVGPPGHDVWLRHLWKASRRPGTPPAARAFVAGFMLHSAGDMFGHTFVNHFTGGAFDTRPGRLQNAISHLLIDTYVGTKTPDVVVDRRDKPSERIRPRDISIAGAEDFIYRAMINVAPPAPFDSLFPAEDSKMSIPWIYSDIRARLVRDTALYSAVLAQYRNAGLTTDAEWWVFTQRPARDRKVQWIQDIDRGLRALPGYSERIVLALLYPIAHPSGLDAAQDIAAQYLRNHVLAMSGVPEAGHVLQAAHDIGKVIDEITAAVIPPEIGQAIDQVKADILNFMFRHAFGMTLGQIQSYVTSPETHFDSTMKRNPSVGGKVVTRARMDSLLGLYARDPRKPDRYLEYWRVPALYNTVVLSKLSLLAPEAINHLLDQLGSGLRTTEPVMLGFLPSIDGDNQWHGGADTPPGTRGPVMIFADECSVYTQIFMEQVGETGQYACEKWHAATPVAAAATRQAVTRASPARPADFMALRRAAVLAVRRPVRPPPRPRVNPADVAFQLTVPVLDRWAKAAGPIAGSPIASELARDRGDPLTPAVDALAAALERSRTAAAAIGAAGFSPRDFALAHLTLVRAAAAQRHPPHARGVSAANVQFVAAHRQEIERLLREARLAWLVATAAP